MAIVLFAVLVRLTTLPVNLWAARAQSKFVEVQAIIKPAIASVHDQYKGAEQSERILAIYKEHGVSPFSGLKGSVGLFVQIPFLLAVFNITTESSLLSGESFLWISDLASPDAAMALPGVLPLMGANLNVLPILLGIVNLLSTVISNKSQSESRGIGVAITLLVIAFFYSFAAGLVLYWLAINSFQALERFCTEKLNKGATPPRFKPSDANGQ
jgi:YidC/Oxa1 family membrane protein insertase